MPNVMLAGMFVNQWLNAEYFRLFGETWEDSVWHRAKNPGRWMWFCHGSSLYDKTCACVLAWACVLLKEEMQTGRKWKKKAGDFFSVFKTSSSLLYESHSSALPMSAPYVRDEHMDSGRSGMSSSEILSHLHTFACTLKGRGFDLSGSFPLTCEGSNQAINHNLWCSKHVHFKETFAFVEQSTPSLRATLDANSEAMAHGIACDEQAGSLSKRAWFSMALPIWPLQLWLVSSHMLPVISVSDASELQNVHQSEIWQWWTCADSKSDTQG